MDPSWLCYLSVPPFVKNKQNHPFLLAAECSYSIWNQQPSQAAKISTRLKESSASRIWCIKRPGVAMTKSGLLAKCSLQILDVASIIKMDIAFFGMGRWWLVLSWGGIDSTVVQRCLVFPIAIFWGKEMEQPLQSGRLERWATSACVCDRFFHVFLLVSDVVSSV